MVIRLTCTNNPSVTNYCCRNLSGLVMATRP